MMKQKFLWVAAALMMAACSGSDNENGTDPVPVICPIAETIELTPVEQELVSENNDFAFNLFRQTQDVNKSQVLSPLSITYALGMLNNGAAGETQRQINQVLGFKDKDTANEFCKKMLTKAPSLDPQTTVSIANNIYLNKDYALKPVFVEKASTFYDAQPETRDFHDGQTLGVINQWASDHTQGMIKEVLNNKTFNPNAVSYLLNATYFKGTWASKFNKESTLDEDFQSYSQPYPKVPMMHQTGEFDYAETDTYQALRKSYGNGAYAMTILLPQAGKTVADVLKGLTADSWKQLHESLTETEVQVALPRFESHTDVDLADIMCSLGMPDAFDEMKAEFPDFCEKATFIGLMKQVAAIKVNEEGAEASAVTVIGMYETAVGPQMMKFFYANRPFLYFISEQSTGTIFFMGQYSGK